MRAAENVADAVGFTGEYCGLDLFSGIKTRRAQRTPADSRSFFDGRVFFSGRGYGKNAISEDQEEYSNKNEYQYVVRSEIHTYIMHDFCACRNL